MKNQRINHYYRQQLIVFFLSLTLLPLARADIETIHTHPQGIFGFDIHESGLYWWKSGKTSDNQDPGYIGLVGTEGANPTVIAEDKLIIGPDGNVARDEAYAYYFTESNDGWQLQRRALGLEKFEPGTNLPLSGLPNPTMSRLLPGRVWAVGDHLYWGTNSFRLNGSTNYVVNRLARDGTGNISRFATLSGKHEPMVKIRRFRYLRQGNPFSAVVTSTAVLTADGRLYQLDGGSVPPKLLHQSIVDFDINPLGIGSQSTVFHAVEGESRDPLVNPDPNHYVTFTVGNSGVTNRKVHYSTTAKRQLLGVTVQPRRTLLGIGQPNVFITEAAVSDTGFGIVFSNPVVKRIADGQVDLFLSGDSPANARATRDWVYYLSSLNTIKRRHTDAPPQEIDIEAFPLGLEVTQGVQNPSHTANLVAGKLTYVRAFARLKTNTTSATSWFVPARLRVLRNNNSLDGSPLFPVEKPVLTKDIDLTSARQDSTLQYLFRLPSAWTNDAAELRFTLELDPLRTLPEADDALANNSSTVTVDLHAKQPTYLKFRPVVAKNAPLYLPDDPGSDFAKIIARTRTMLPLSNVELRIDNEPFYKPVISVEIEILPCPGIPLPCPVPVVHITEEAYDLNNDDDKGWALFWLGVERLLTSDPGDDYHIVGAVHDSFPNFNGFGGQSGITLSDFDVNLPPIPLPDTDFSSVLAVTMRRNANGAADFNAPYGGRTLAHELGHNYGRRHINQDVAVCGGGTPEGPYHTPPFNTCLFGDTTTPQSTIVGFDRYKRIVVPNDGTVGDLMTYARDRWTSDFTWNAIFNRIPNAPAALQKKKTKTVPRQKNDSRFILVSGHFSRTADQGRILPARTLPLDHLNQSLVSESLGTASELGSGFPYQICQRDSEGKLLGQSAVVPFPIPDEGSDLVFYLQTVECMPGMAKLELCKNGAVLSEMQRSPNNPTVEVAKPSVEDTGGLSVIQANWTASDPDGTPLVFDVSYSPDNGQTWQTIRNNYTHTSLVFKNDLPGGANARLRVVASDGMNSAVAMSPPFAVDLKPPTIWFDDTFDNPVIPQAELPTANFTVYDAEDGYINGVSVKIDGPQIKRFADTPEVDLSDLVPGNYDLSVTATDSDGQSTEKIREFEVGPVIVPDYESGAPVLDGLCNDTAYTASATTTLRGNSTAAFVHVNNTLYACIDNLPLSATNSEIALFFDPNDSGDATAQPGDIGFSVDQNGLPRQFAAQGGQMTLDPSPTLGARAIVHRGVNGWSAEFAIPDSLLGGWDHAARMLVVLDSQTNAQTLTTTWPANGDRHSPVTWAAAWFGAAPPKTNLSPVALAPQQTLLSPATSVTHHLDASGSFDPDGDVVTYSWEQIGGPPVTLSEPTSATPSFTATPGDTNRNMVFKVTVSDGESSSESSTRVTITKRADPYQPGTGLPRVRVVRIDVGQEVEIEFRGVPRNSYLIQESANLIQWSDVTVLESDDQGRFRFNGPPSTKTRYYRVVVPTREIEP